MNCVEFSEKLKYSCTRCRWEMSDQGEAVAKGASDPRGRQAGHEIPPDPGKRFRVLIVEDNPAMVQVVRFNLERSGYDVRHARNGQEGWTCALKQQFDVIIVDDQMPVMTGLELTERLVATERYAHVPIIMLTARQLELDAKHLHDTLRIEVLLPKPFSPVELVKTVGECLAVRANQISASYAV